MINWRELLLIDALGFNYEDFVAVRTAIREVYLDRFFAARDTLGEIAQEWSDGEFAEQPPSRIEQGRAAVHDLMFFPGIRASFTASDIASVSGIDLERIEHVLQRFSVAFGAASDPVAAVDSYLAGDSIFRNAALVVDEQGNYITLNVPIGTDCFRQVVETAMKTDPARWKRYERRRVAVSEQLAVEHLATLLGTSGAHVDLKYFCQWPIRTAHGRPVEMPAGGHENCPLMANRSAHLGFGGVGHARSSSF